MLLRASDAAAAPAHRIVAFARLGSAQGMGVPIHWSLLQTCMSVRVAVDRETRRAPLVLRFDYPVTHLRLSPF